MKDAQIIKKETLKEEKVGNWKQLPKLFLNSRQIKEAKNIARGVYAPLRGFLKEGDYQSVLEKMRLTSGELWSIPIVLDIDKKEQEQIESSNSRKVALLSGQGEFLGILEQVETFAYDKSELAQGVYQTQSPAHPGVQRVNEMKEFLLGGDLLFLEEIINHKEVFPRHNYTPKETRAEFARRGWQTVVAFQTRNVPHRGHEFLQKEALKLVDGLLVQPVIGKKKDQDFKDEYIVASYEALIDNYFDPERVMLGVLPLDMYYAGPKEALMHALIRKNFGCTHFIVGRDHAGVGDFYAPLAAQEIFEQFDAKELGIEILKFEEVTYDGRNQQPCFVSQCPREEQVNFSGTRLRQFLEKQKTPPEYLIRPEVYNILVNATNSLVDQMYQKENSNQKGFVLWFTGLSAAGKSTTADQVFKLLQKENGLRLERLDGDVVRENLTKELGFSKEDRDENIRRVGFVSDLLSRNGVGVIASFISPYRSQRGELREKVHNFIEVFVDASLKVCEERDPKGLYKKARTGEIKCFTGISDDYEIPKNPDLHLRTDQHSPEECAQKVVDYLRKQQLI